MTNLTKRIRRMSNATCFERGVRRIIITLEPSQCIGLRLERTRRTYLLPISTAFNYAAQITADAERRRFERRVKELVRAGMTRRAAKKQAREEQ